MLTMLRRKITCRGDTPLASPHQMAPSCLRAEHEQQQEQQKKQGRVTMARVLFLLAFLFALSVDLASACTTYTSSSSVQEYDLSTSGPVTIQSHTTGGEYASNKKCWW